MFTEAVKLASSGFIDPFASKYRGVTA